MQQQHSQQPQVDPAHAVLSKIRSLSYLSGEEAAGVLEQFVSANRQQQTIAYLLAKRIADLEQSLSGVRGDWANNTFQSKIAKVREQLEIPEDWQQNLEELYLAYEGDDLDQQFPEIAKKWYERTTSTFAKLEKARLEAARKTPFIPGKGGQGTPSKPLQLTGAESASEQADKVGQMFGLDFK
jgi:hypothetical protein